MPLTREQQRILAHRGDCIINAIAGSGKTTTLIEYTKQLPKTSRVLYIVFNTSMKHEALAKFSDAGLGHVDIETAHSLAYKHIVHQHISDVQHREYTLDEIRALCGLSRDPDGYALARHIRSYFNYYCNSEYDSLDSADYCDIQHSLEDQNFVQEHVLEIVDGAQKLWTAIDTGDCNMTHDFYLKKFHLSRTVLPYEYILFDEAQDASGAMLGIIRHQQHAQRIMVGDTHQQIYGWRYAVNSLERVDFPIHYLSASFRFPSEIATYAMRVLSLKKKLGYPMRMSIVGKGGERGNGATGYIARTNQGLLELLLNHIHQPNPEAFYCEGGLPSYVFGGNTLLMDAVRLYEGKRVTRGPLARMQSFEDFEAHAHHIRNIQWSLIIDMVKRYREDLVALIDTLASYHGNREEVRHIFSTVHKCKGMEYETVHLAQDFITEDAIINASEQELSTAKRDRLIEEINILYVAITRAQKHIIFPEGMEWVTS